MAIRWDKFTVKAQEAVQRASELASEHGNPEVLPLHLLASLLEDKEGIVPPIMEKIGIGPQSVLNDLYQEIGRLPKISGAAAQATLSQAANQLLDRAFKEADTFKDEYVSTEHLLLAATQLKRDPAQEILARYGATHDAILKALTSVRGSQRVQSSNPEATYEALERYGRDLVKEAKKDNRIVAITAAMPSGTGIDIFAKAFPTRTFDVGIAEQSGGNSTILQLSLQFSGHGQSEIFLVQLVRKKCAPVRAAVAGIDHHKINGSIVALVLSRHLRWLG